MRIQLKCNHKTKTALNFRNKNVEQIKRINVILPFTPFSMFKIVRRITVRSKSLLWLIAASWLLIIFICRPWQKNLIVNDVVSYYAYLPATFIYNDIKLEKSDYHTEEGTYLFWPVQTPDGKKVIKTTMGLSFLYAPFFFTGHAAAKLSGAPADGFSTPYQVSILFGCLFYLLAGLYFLRKLLLLFFSEVVTSLTLLSVFFGTNLLWYTTLDGLMAHGYLFSLLTLFLYHTLRWHRGPKESIAVCIGLELGLMTLIRPTMFLCVLAFLLFGAYNAASVKTTLLRFKTHFFQLLIIALCFVAILLPQLLYWKYAAGKWLFFPYVDEHFYFSHPHIIEGLFSFRKGWLLYTPVMIFSLAGLFYMKRERSPYFLPVIILLPLYVYILFSWWAWWYGGGFGMRAMVDFYGLLAIPMACFYKQVTTVYRSRARYGILALAVFFVYLNLFQSLEYEKGLIHYDAMTKDAYFAVFLDKKPKRFFEYLSDPDYRKARAGLPETYTKEEVMHIRPTDRINLKGSNFKIIGFGNDDAGLRAAYYEMGKTEDFSIVFLGGNKIALKAGNGKFVSADHSRGDKLIANRDQAQSWETFELIYLGDNKIALRSDNGRYVGISNDAQGSLIADSDTISFPETIHLFIDF